MSDTSNAASSESELLIKHLSEQSQRAADVQYQQIKEARRDRRWKIFFRLVIVLYVGVGIFAFSGLFGSSEKRPSDHPHVAVVDIKGAITEQISAPNANKIIQSLQKAFEAPNVNAVILDINSPGGSPVQSAQIYREIVRLRVEYPDMPVVAVGADMMASGAYYIASAADSIYADPTSIVGSVGVVMSGFGFSPLMDKVGVERRVYTAGESKAFMDPFLDESPEVLSHIDSMLVNIHETFINDVKAGRGDRLKGTDDELFNGLVWTGEQALSFGLIDGLGSVGEVSRGKFGIDQVVNYTVRPNPFEQLAQRMSSHFAAQLAANLGWQIQAK